MKELENPWGKFLDARLLCIQWYSNKGRSDEEIAEILSCDEKQVFLIRTHPMNDKNGGKIG